MVERMIANQVALIMHALNDLRVALHIVAGDKEGRRRVFFLQNVQNFFCIAIFISGIKGEVDNLGIWVAHIDQVIIL